MYKRLNYYVVISLLLILNFSLTYAQSTKDSINFNKKDHSIDLCPLSPVIGIYAIHYTYKFSLNNALILAPSYMHIKYKNIGHTNAPGIILGYRRYLWKNLHVDYQLMPMFDRYYAEDEQKTYPWSFDLWNEFRLGYEFDFNIKETTFFINLQWPLGFALYSDPKGKPDSFKEKARKSPLFYFPPLFFLGIRF